MSLRLMLMGLAAMPALLVAEASAQYVLPAAPAPVVSYYAPPLTAPVVSYAPVVAPSYPPVVTYSPVTPVIAAPRVVSYYPAAPVVSTYRPVVSTYQPVVSTYQPVVSTYRPVVTAYSPAVSYGYAGSPVVVRPKVYVPGQPIRNVLRAITP